MWKWPRFLSSSSNRSLWRAVNGCNEITSSSDTQCGNHMSLRQAIMSREGGKAFNQSRILQIAGNLEREGQYREQLVSGVDVVRVRVRVANAELLMVARDRGNSQNREFPTRLCLRLFALSL